MKKPVHPEPVEGELPDFLKRGFPDIGLPPAKVGPSRMAFPEMRAPVEPGLHDTASMGEWVVRDWLRHVDAGHFWSGG